MWGRCLLVGGVEALAGLVKVPHSRGLADWGIVPDETCGKPG
jgi:hypothetical protein